MENVTWYGNAGFSFVDKSGKRIYYIDPYHLPHKDLPKADIIFITHAHPDHLSEGDIDKLLKEDTVVVATPDSLETLKITQKKFPVEPNNYYDIGGFKFQTVPAYNLKPERLSFHPKENKWVGYVFELNGKKIYHAGDTDFIPEMREFSKWHLDVAMLPMGGHYTMDVVEMIEAAKAIQAKTVIPMHYKMQLGGQYKDAEEQLKKELKDMEVLILKELA
ncbi:MAG: MBL fold metallo-hydrolase [Candidatus Levyibacteriota bacterium]